MSNSKREYLYRFLVFYYLFFLHISSVDAQNLVFNPSFSKTKGESFLFWQQIAASPTAFYYKSNGGLGDTAVSFIAEQFGKVPKSRTYFFEGKHLIYARLKEPLQAGTYYRLALNVKQADSSLLLLEALGLDFEKDNEPAISFDLSEVNGSRAWFTFESVYLAKGGERYLFIGKFSEEQTEYAWNDRFPQKKYKSKWERVQDGFRHHAIYAVDNVTVEKIPDQPSFSHSQKFVPGNVFFETGKHELSEESKTYLLMLASFLRTNKNLLISVEGFADKRGNDDYNLQLSKNRATSAAEFLLKQGIVKSRIKPLWHGSKGADEAPTNYHLDRKVQFEIVSRQ